MTKNKRHSIARIRFVSCLVGSLVGAFGAGLGGCSAAPEHDDALATNAAEALTPSAAQTCPSGATATVIAFAPEGETLACADIPGDGGTWIDSGPKGVRVCTATRDPERGQPYACSYKWSRDAGWPSAPPDTRVLDALAGAYVSVTNAAAASGATTCGDASMLPYAALLDEAGVTCPPPPGSGGPDGPRPCDVCGVPLFPGVIYGSMWLPASNRLDTVSVALSNGTHQILTIGAPVTRKLAANASRLRHAYVSIALPELPAGVTYEDGPALGYGYTVPSKP